MENIVAMTVCFVSIKHGVVIRGLEKVLENNGLTVLYAGLDMGLVREKESEIRVFVLCLEDDMDDIFGAAEFVDSIVSKGGRSLVVVGEKRQVETLKGWLPHLSVTSFIYRPVEPEDFAIEVVELIRSSVLENKKDKKSLLLVDDDPLYAKMVQEWLKYDYKVGVVTSGFKAINYLSENPTDLVLLDYEMPGADGAQVLESIRSDEDIPEVPVVFLTGVNTKKSVEKVMSMKPDGYILKSTSRNELLEWLELFFWERENT